MSRKFPNFSEIMSTNGAAKHFFEFDEFRVEVEERRLLRAGRPVTLASRDFDILLALIQDSGQTVDKNDLMETVWEDTFVEEGNLNRHISTLRKVLGDDPKQQRLIKTVPKRGYRFTADVREIVEEADIVGLESASRSKVVITEETTEGFWTTSRFAIAGILMVALAAIGWLGLGRNIGDETSAATGGSNTLAVIPFRNLKPDPGTDYLSYALAQSITGKLGYVRVLTVRPTASGEKYREQPDTKAIATALNARSLLMGSYLLEEDTLRITVELIDANNDRVAWQNVIDVDFNKLSTVQDRIAGDVIRGLNLTLTDAETQQLKRYLPNAAAYEYDLRGIAFSKTSDYLSALKMYEKAVEADPNYALAWTHIAAVCYFYSNDKTTGPAYRKRAETAIERALALEPDQIEARLEKAFQMIDNEGRGEEAIPILRGIIETNDNIANAHWYLSQAYRYGGVLDESIAEGRRAVEIDPDVMWDTTFNSLFYAGRHDEFLSTMAHKPEGARNSFYRGLAYAYLNDRDRAIREFDRSYQIDATYPHAVIGQAMKASLTGQNAMGSKLLRDLERDRILTDGEMLYKLAQAHAMLDNKTDALRLLNRTVEQNFFCYPYFATDTLLDNMRGEPGFAEFLNSANRRHEKFKQQFF